MKLFEKLIYSILSSKIKKTIVFVLIFASLIGTIMMLPTKMVLAKMLPGKSANTYSIYVNTPTGSSVEQTKSITQCVTGILRHEKYITNMEVYLGQGAPLNYAGLVKGSAFKRGENVAEMVINLTDKHKREEKSYDMVHRLRPVIQKKCQNLIPGTHIKMIQMPAGPPTLASIVVELYNHNIHDDRKMAKRIAKVLKSTKGLVDVDIMEDDIYNRFSIIINKNKVLRSGLSIEQINKILYLAFQGVEVTVKNSPDTPDQIPLFEVLSGKTKKLKKFSKNELLAKLSSLKLMNKRGMMIPLSEVVSIKEVKSKPSIMQKDLRRMTNITAETDEVSQVYPLIDARDKIIKEFSKDYYIKKESIANFTHMFDLHLTNKKTGEKFDLVWNGEMKVTLDTFRDLGLAFIAALVLIFLLLVVYYESFRISGIILFGSFLSIIGVIFGHWVMNLFTRDTFYLTATSLIGFIALMGISSRNSLLLIDFAKSLMKKGIEKREAIAVATATRAKPIMLTAAAIILASILLAGDPIFGGLGVALIFGTIAAVIVSLIFVPILMDNTKAI